MQTRIKKFTKGEDTIFTPEYYTPVFKWWKLKFVWEWKTFTKVEGWYGGTHTSVRTYSRLEDCEEFLEFIKRSPEKETTEYI